MDMLLKQPTDLIDWVLVVSLGGVFDISRREPSAVVGCDLFGSFNGGSNPL